ncbi:MAG: hypothetical protein JNJ61_28700 [Anaerolineae bacterium]|nr:hypothetical protein [Anaerolineae bacterium]
MKEIERSIARISSLDFNKPSRNHDLMQSLLLFKEYLRRMLLWSQALAVRGWPFTILAKYIDPSVQIDPTIEDQFKKILYPTPFIRTTCMSYLMWALIENTPIVNSYALPNPYEPLIQMYEGGYYFYREHHVVVIEGMKGEVNTIMLTPDLYNTDIPFISLDI